MRGEKKADYALLTTHYSTLTTPYSLLTAFDAMIMMIAVMAKGDDR